MPSGRRLVRCLVDCLAVATIAGLVPGPAAAAFATGTAPPAPRTAPTAAQSLTLVTGDRVTVRRVAGQEHVEAEPGEGRRHVRFSIWRGGGHLYVVPSDAISLVGSGRVDRRLFDVTAQLAFGYGDAKRADVPLIVTYQRGATRASARTTLSAAGVTVGQALPADAVAARVDKRKAASVWSALTTGSTLRGGVAKVWLDGVRRPLLDRSVPQIGAPAAWQTGLTGKGVTVAVLDTGVDATHPDLAGRIAEARNFTAAPDTRDQNGHGTHVASTIAGSGAASDGRYRGVAPDARLLIGKVCAGVQCLESAILAGMRWAAESGAKVVNLSLGYRDTPEIDPLEAAVDDLTATHGTLFVASAGNSGPNGGTVVSPASADAALAVGAVDRNDQIAPFSSRGPRVGDAGVKPELTAPGVAIVAARAAGTQLGELVGEHYVTGSGTSMAAPHVAGAAALLAQRHPDWTADQLKAALVGSAEPNPSLDAYTQGAGRVTVERAVNQTMTGTPATLSMGRQSWPHHDDEPVTKTVTYRNTGPEPVTLALSVAVADQSGKPAPAGMFTTSASQVTVPAGGTATVEVTVDTRVAGPDGRYSGYLVATADDTVVRIPVGVEKEVETYQLTIQHRDRNGDAPTEFVTLVTGPDVEWWAHDPTGTVTARLPKGRYIVDSTISTPRAGDPNPDLSWLIRPAFDLVADTTLSVDARVAKPVQVTVPHVTARPHLSVMGYDRPGDDALDHSVLLWGDTAGFTTAQLGPSAADDDMRGYYHAMFAEPGPDGDFLDSPYVYHLGWSRPGGIHDGLTATVTADDLATVRATYHAERPGDHANTVVAPVPPGWSVPGLLGTPPMSLPFQRTEYYLAAAGEWHRAFSQLNGDQTGVSSQFVLAAAPQSYRAGRTYRQHWKAAVFGPGFAPNVNHPYQLRTGPHAGRTGDQIQVMIPMYSDQVADHAGYLDWTDGLPHGRTTLYRDGTKVGETDRPGEGDFTVPAEPGTYRLEVVAERGAPFQLSTRQTAAWTFRSARPSGDGPDPLPLMAVRFAPPLDVDNSAPAGEPFLLPVSVQRQAGAAPATVRSLTVEVSYDDGETWQAARLVPDGRGGWQATLRHPTDVPYVSLRAKATDTAGNIVEQTIIRAYRLG